MSGLYAGDDVRISGVQVGKVESIRLDGRIAKVDFTAQEDHPVFANTVAAVRYQTLVGQRYVELVQPAKPDQRLPAGGNIPVGADDSVVRCGEAVQRVSADIPNP